MVGSVNEAHDKDGGAMPNKIFSCFVFLRTKCQRTDLVFINKINEKSTLFMLDVHDLGPASPASPRRRDKRKEHPNNWHCLCSKKGVKEAVCIFCWIFSCPLWLECDDRQREISYFVIHKITVKEFTYSFVYIYQISLQTKLMEALRNDGG